MGGYAVECRLKAIAMEIYGCWTLRELSERLDVTENDVFQHGLEALLGKMPKGLQDNMKADRSVWRAFTGQVNRWKVSWRYAPRPLTGEEAQTFLYAVDTVFDWLDANRA
jgi:hypothetical protein